MHGDDFVVGTLMDGSQPLGFISKGLIMPDTRLEGMHTKWTWRDAGPWVTCPMALDTDATRRAATSLTIFCVCDPCSLLMRPAHVVDEHVEYILKNLYNCSQDLAVRTNSTSMQHSVVVAHAYQFVVTAAELHMLSPCKLYYQCV